MLLISKNLMWIRKLNCKLKRNLLYSEIIAEVMSGCVRAVPIDSDIRLNLAVFKTK